MGFCIEEPIPIAPIEWMNYDFAKHWNIIHPALSSPAYIFKFVDSTERTPAGLAIYDLDLSPAVNIGENKYGLFAEALKERAIEQRDPTVPMEIHDEVTSLWEQDEVDHEEVSGRIIELEDQIKDQLGWDWRTNKTQMASYVCTCPSLEYFKIIRDLAEQVCPRLKWEVLVGSYATTVVNYKERRVFDLTAFCLDNRLEDHTFGRPYTSTDPTLGGLAAYERASYTT